MTKEEILSLKPGRELDALVAKMVMGLGKYDSWEEFELKPYSTDISAAWEIIEQFPIFELEKESIFASSHYLPPTWLEDGIWCVLTDDRWNRFVGYGETAPEAICKAALLAKNVA